MVRNKGTVTFSETQSELIMEFDKIKRWNTEHRDICFQLEKMCNFMIEGEVTIGEVESTNKQEARSIIALSEKHDKDTDASVIKGKRRMLSGLRKGRE